MKLDDLKIPATPACRGALEVATERRASWPPSSNLATAGCGRSAVRVRHEKASAISASVQSGPSASALNRIWARRTFRLVPFTSRPPSRPPRRIVEEGLQVYQMLRQEDDQRRAMIRSGEISPETAAELNPMIRATYAVWLQAARKLKSWMEILMHQFSVVEHSGAFGDAMIFAEDVVRGKRPPVVIWVSMILASLLN